MRKDLLILIPAFNESETIGALIKSIQAEADYADILVVNDGSKDETSFVSKAHGAAVVTHVFKHGLRLGAAGGLQIRGAARL